VKLPDWLSHLRTDRRGRPVPFVNRWGTVEDRSKVAVQFDPLVGMDAAFYFDAGEQEPDFTAQSMQRQRRCMVLGECQVCGRPVPWSRRHLVISSVSTGVITSKGPRQGAMKVVEPWLDRRCAEFAIRYCPALIRRGRAEDLTLIEVTSKNDVELVITRGWIEGFPQTKAAPVAIWAELVLRQPVLAAAG
jgi:hypothetical protein